MLFKKKNPALGYGHMVQFLIFLKNLEVLFAARKERNKEPLFEEMFCTTSVQDLYPKGICKWISTAVSLLWGHLWHLLQKPASVCAACVYLSTSTTARAAAQVREREERFTAFCKFMAWKWACKGNSTTCWPAGSGRILLQTLQWVREEITSPESSFWKGRFQAHLFPWINYNPQVFSAGF